MNLKENSISLFSKFINEELKKDELQDTKDGVKDGKPIETTKDSDKPVSEDPEEVKDPGLKNESDESYDSIADSKHKPAMRHDEVSYNGLFDAISIAEFNDEDVYKARKAQEILDNGEILDSWPIDMNPETGESESNGGQEFKVKYEGQIYIVQTDWENNAYTYIDYSEFMPEAKDRKFKVTTYKFSELSPEAKEKAKKSYYESVQYGCEQYEFLQENLTEILKADLKEAGIEYEDLEVLYSLSYSQGDGLCFTGKFKDNDFSVVITHRGRYYHSNSVDFQFYDEAGEEIEDNEEFKKWYKDECKKLEKEGYAEVEYIMDDKEFSELSDDNGWEFTEDGTIFNGVKGGVEECKKKKSKKDKESTKESVANEQTYTVIAKGITDEVTAKKIAQDKRGVVQKDPEDKEGKRFMVIVRQNESQIPKTLKVEYTKEGKAQISNV